MLCTDKQYYTDTGMPAMRVSHGKPQASGCYDVIRVLCALCINYELGVTEDRQSQLTPTSPHFSEQIPNSRKICRFIFFPPNCSSFELFILKECKTIYRRGRICLFYK